MSEETNTKLDISVEHQGKDDGAILTLLPQNPELPGISATLSRQARYALAEALLNPNGSGYMRSLGQMDRAVASAEELAEREARVAKAKEQAEKGREGV